MFLPEASDYIAPSPAETVSLAKAVTHSEFVLGLQADARKYQLPINVGIHEPTQGGDKVKNTLIWIDEKGEITQRYQKLHLFDVEIKDGPILRESKYVAPFIMNQHLSFTLCTHMADVSYRSVEEGSQILPPFDTPIGRLGLMICFDLRFPELSLSLSQPKDRAFSPAQILTYPSAFTVPTGRAHWQTLLRARAIECQSYVIAAAQCGPHNEAKSRFSYGNSLIVNPWGEIVAELGAWGDEGETKGVEEPDIAVADIDLDRVEKVRREMPLNRRTDVYHSLP